MRKELFWLFAVAIFLKFTIFDVIWAFSTTFAPFSTVEFYVTKIIVSLLLAAPVCFFRLWRVEAILMFLLDLLLVANLMYFRTYYTAIPLSSYGLSGNLADFTGSVYDSLRWCDLLFPLSTVGTLLLFLHWRRRGEKDEACDRLRPRFYWGALGCFLLLLVVVNRSKGGFKEAYDRTRQQAYLCSSCASIYTVFGSLCYDLVCQDRQLTLADRQEIDDYLAQQPPYRPLVSDSLCGTRNHCILIFAESLESWVLERQVEGKEITPCLNRLLEENTTLYAPRVLTQVKGGRSIDAQLMVCAGLLPVNSGTYSSQFPDNTYFTLQRAMREEKQARNYLLTIDKVSTWNQGAIANSFGVDTILAYHDFELTEAFGTHKRVGDGAFFAQCRRKMEQGEIWKPGERVYMQFVTYSGHAPFRMPDALKTVSFSDRLPIVMRDYMTVAHYTDRAIGQFIDYLKSRPEYRETLIVIMGDHEGLAHHRDELCNTSEGRGIVSDKQFTPFIVVNSPVGMRYEQVMGQIDIYPTLLNLLQLDTYPWKGLGQSILDPGKKGFAVGSQLNVEGEGYTPEELERAKRAYDVSDKLIRGDYLKQLQKN